MGTDETGLDRALDTLRRELGPDRVLVGDAATQLIRQRSLNPESDASIRYLLRPRNTEECRVVVETLAAVGAYPNPTGALTTFWDPDIESSTIGVDTLALESPLRIDPAERVGYFGAAATIREVDLAARSHGLCLVAYPDSDGSQSVGSMAAVACTTGLGLGRSEPVEQIVGLTIVTRDARVVKTGSAWRLGRGGVTNGLPDPTGIFLGSQGRFGIITEVVLKLQSAPFLAAHSWHAPWLEPGELAQQLRRARQTLDQGTVDSLRLETVCAGTAQPEASEWYLRCWAPNSSKAADRHCAEAAATLDACDPRRWVESEAARRGELPDYDQRFSVPPGEHQTRTGRDGFLGIEVNINWGDQLDATLSLFASMFKALAPLGLGHRRLGIYPSAHAVSVGVQAMLTGGSASADALRQTLAEYVAPLNELGAVPYRAGRLWQPTIERWEITDPACAMVRRAGLSESPS